MCGVAFHLVSIFLYFSLELRNRVYCAVARASFAAFAYVGLAFKFVSFDLL